MRSSDRFNDNIRAANKSYARKWTSLLSLSFIFVNLFQLNVMHCKKQRFKVPMTQKIFLPFLKAGCPISRRDEIPWLNSYTYPRQLRETAIKFLYVTKTVKGGLGACSPGQKIFKIRMLWLVETEFHTTTFSDFSLTFLLPLKFLDISRFSRSLDTLWKLFKNQEDSRLLFLNIFSSSKVIKA